MQNQHITKLDLLDLGLKLVGVYLILELMWSLQNLFINILLQFVEYPNTPGTYISIELLWIFIVCVIIWVLLFHTNWITDKMKVNNLASFSLTVKRDWLEVGTALISLMMIALAVADVAAILIEKIYFHRPSLGEFWSSERIAKLLGGAVQMITGLFLLLNAKNFPNWLKMH